MISIKTLEKNAAIANDIKIFDDIHLSTKNIVVYRRSIESLKESLHFLLEKSVEFKESGTIGEIAYSLNTYLAGKLPNHLDLVKDVIYLLESFKRVARVSSFRVILSKIGNTMCPKFHSDINQLRMLCTYHGPGTLWVSDYVASRKIALTHRGNENILANEGLIQQVDTGDVVILKGTLYPDGIPILHRSPSVSENGEERILLRIDLNESLSLPL